MRARTHEYGVPVVGCCRSSTTQLRVNRSPAYDITFLYFANAGLVPYGRSRKLYSATSMGRSPGGSRLRRIDVYGHSIVRYSVRTSIIRPASSNSTLTPAIASWNAAIPPAAPLPTTMTSQRSLPGLIESASRFDSSSERVRLTLRVGSSCMCMSLPGQLKGTPCSALPLPIRFLTAVRTVLAVDRLAAHELPEELIALVAQLLLNGHLRCVVAADRRLFGHHEERLERRLGRALVAADGLEDRVDLTWAEAAERRPEPRHGVSVDRREPAEPLQ